MSGVANVKFWLQKNKIEQNEAKVTRILNFAKNQARVLTNDDLLDLCTERED